MQPIKTLLVKCVSIGGSTILDSLSVSFFCRVSQVFCYPFCVCQRKDETIHTIPLLGYKPDCILYIFHKYTSQETKNKEKKTCSMCNGVAMQCIQYIHVCFKYVKIY